MWKEEYHQTKQGFLFFFFLYSFFFSVNFNCTTILEDSQNYMPPILVPSSAKCIVTQILVIAKSNGRKNFILRGFICDIIRPSKELAVQS